jgi:nucleoside 2-deoxyribosyltransferase
VAALRAGEHPQPVAGQLRRRAIYLAGPDVFLPDAAAIGRAKKEICRRHGFDARFPTDDPAGPLTAEGIFDACVAMMRSCDLAVANLTPFRGISMDVGTAVEIGFMLASGRPVYGYTNVVAHYGHRARGALADLGGELVEDFDLADNLMCEGAIARSGGLMVRHDAAPDRIWTDLAGFERCVQLIRPAPADPGPRR